ncbi:hypothetical protein Tco_0879803, partial [Tanacetum coccineum]
MSASNTSNNSNQQTLADSGANARPPMLEKGNYIPWESQFKRLLVPNPHNPGEQILEPLSKMTKGDKNKYIANVRVMNYILQAIPNDIYNLVDACANERIKRLMHRSDITADVRHSRLMDEFDKFAAKEGESLDSVFERLTTLVNIMDRNNVRPITVAINTKFLNCLQPEWSKYVTMVRQNQADKAISYDVLYDSLVQFEPHVLASREKKATRNHDPLALIAHSNASSSHIHANSSYSPQSYHVTHPPSVVDYDDEYQGELQGDSKEDKFTTAMMLLAREISQKFSSPTNNRLCLSSNTKNQDVVHDGRVDIQTKNAGYGGIANKNMGRNRNQIAIIEMRKVIMLVTVRNQKFVMLIREQMLLAIKDEAGSHLGNEENDFMLDNAYDEESLDELTASVMLMARLQPAVKLLTLCHHMMTKLIIFDDPYVDNNGGTSKHDSIAHEENHEIQMLAYTVQREAEKQKCLNHELKKQKDLLQQELETFKDRLAKKAFKERENQYLKDIVDLEKILSSHDQIVYKIVTRAQHQKEVDELIQYVNQKTYAYGDVRAKNQDLLMTISELKSKSPSTLRNPGVIEHISLIHLRPSSGKRVCVTPFNKHIADKAMNVSSTKVIQLVLWFVDSRCSKHMIGNLQLLRNFIEKFIGTVRFGNDHFAAITCYGDYVQGNLTICHVYYVEGLGHNLFSVGQLCDGDLEGKSKKVSLPPKLVPSTESKLELLHMDLCGPMRVASINGKKYILVIVDDYSR